MYRPYWIFGMKRITCTFIYTRCVKSWSKFSAGFELFQLYVLETIQMSNRIEFSLEDGYKLYVRNGAVPWHVPLCCGTSSTYLVINGKERWDLEYILWFTVNVLFVYFHDKRVSSRWKSFRSATQSEWLVRNENSIKVTKQMLNIRHHNYRRSSDSPVQKAV